MTNSISEGSVNFLYLITHLLKGWHSSKNLFFELQILISSMNLTNLIHTSEILARIREESKTPSNSRGRAPGSRKNKRHTLFFDITQIRASCYARYRVGVKI